MFNKHFCTLLFIAFSLLGPELFGQCFDDVSLEINDDRKISVEYFLSHRFEEIVFCKGEESEIRFKDFPAGTEFRLNKGGEIVSDNHNGFFTISEKGDYVVQLSLDSCIYVSGILRFTEKIDLQVNYKTIGSFYQLGQDTLYICGGENQRQYQNLYTKLSLSYKLENSSFTWLKNGFPIEKGTPTHLYLEGPGIYQLKANVGECSTISSPMVVMREKGFVYERGFIELQNIAWNKDTVSLCKNNVNVLRSNEYSNWYLNGILQVGDTNAIKVENSGVYEALNVLDNYCSIRYKSPYIKYGYKVETLGFFPQNEYCVVDRVTVRKSPLNSFNDSLSIWNSKTSEVIHIDKELDYSTYVNLSTPDITVDYHDNGCASGPVSYNLKKNRLRIYYGGKFSKSSYIKHALCKGEKLGLGIYEGGGKTILYRNGKEYKTFEKVNYSFISEEISEPGVYFYSTHFFSCPVFSDTLEVITSSKNSYDFSQTRINCETLELTAEVHDDLSIKWFRNGELFSNTKTIRISSRDTAMYNLFDYRENCVYSSPLVRPSDYHKIVLKGDTVLNKGDDIYLRASGDVLRSFFWKTPAGVIVNGENLIIENSEVNDSGVYYLFSKTEICDVDSIPITITVKPDQVIRPFYMENSVSLKLLDPLCDSKRIRALVEINEDARDIVITSNFRGERRFHLGDTYYYSLPWAIVIDLDRFNEKTSGNEVIVKFVNNLTDSLETYTFKLFELNDVIVCDTVSSVVLEKTTFCNGDRLRIDFSRPLSNKSELRYFGLRGNLKYEITGFNELEDHIEFPVYGGLDYVIIEKESGEVLWTSPKLNVVNQYLRLFSQNGSYAHCTGFETPLKASVDYVSRESFKWFKDGSLLDNIEPGTLELSVEEPGFYWIQSEKDGCVFKSDLVEVLVDTIPPPVILGQSYQVYQICENSTGTLKVNDRYNYTDYKWLFNGGVIDSLSGKSEIEVLRTGEYSVQAFQGNCENVLKQPVQIEVNDRLIRPELDLYGDGVLEDNIFTTCSGSEFSIGISNYTYRQYLDETIEYQWERNGQRIDSETPYLRTNESGVYQLILKSGNCIEYSNRIEINHSNQIDLDFRGLFYYNPDIKFANNQIEICKGDKLGIVPFGPQGESFASWDQTLLKNETVVGITNAYKNNSRLSIVDNGIYRIEFSHPNFENCLISTDEFEVKLISSDTINLGSYEISNSNCEERTVLRNYNGSNHEWYFGASLISTNDSAVLGQSGDYFYYSRNQFSCILQKTYKYDRNKELIPNILRKFPEADYLCEGDFIRIYTGFTNPVEHSWFRNDTLISSGLGNSILENTPGVYHFEYEKDGCKRRSNLVDFSPSELPMAWLKGDTILPYSGDVSLKLEFSSKPPFTYTFTNGLEGNSDSIHTIHKIFVSENETFKLKEVSNLCGIGNVFGSAEVQVLVLGKNESETPLILYPSPLIEFCRVELLNTNKTEIEYSIFDSAGREVRVKKNQSLTNNYFIISTGSLPSGNYILEVSLHNQVYRRRFIKK